MSNPFVSLSENEVPTDAFITALLRKADEDFPLTSVRIGSARRLTSKLVLKTTSVFRSRTEVEAMQFVATHCPQIPVPRLHRYWESGGRGYIVMDYVEGEMFGKAMRRLTQEQRETIMGTLARYVADLRRIPQPHPQTVGLPQRGWIGSACGNAMFEPALYVDAARPENRTETSYGPFANQDAFNTWKVGQYDKFGLSHAETKQKLDTLRSKMRADDRIVFTHGDINVKNVLVRVSKDGGVEVTGLLDWEQAGWRPVWWEGLKWGWVGPRTPEWEDFGMKYLSARGEEDIEREEKLWGFAFSA